MSDQNQNQNQSQENQINPDDFKKLQTEKAELETKLNSLASEMDSIKTEKLKAEGNKDEYIKSLETKLKDKDAAIETKEKTLKLQKVLSQFREAAKAEGVIDVDALQSLHADKIKDLKVNGNFEVEGDGLKQILAVAKEKNPYLFNKAAPKIEDLNHKKATNEQKGPSIRDNLKKQLL